MYFCFSCWDRVWINWLGLWGWGGLGGAGLREEGGARPGAGGTPFSVSYTYLTLPTNREI